VTGAFDPKKLNEHVARHVVKAEEKFRLQKMVQDEYRIVREQSPFLMLEDDIQMTMMSQHGVAPQHVHSRSLAEWRMALSAYSHVPSVRQSAFFLRNNIMVPGAPVGAVCDRSLPLFTLSSGEEKCLGNYIDQAASAGKKLVIFAGSLT